MRTLITLLFTSPLWAQSVEIAARFTTAMVPVDSFDVNQDPGFTRSGPYFYFWARTPATGTELWRTDGTPSGTIALADIGPALEHGRPQVEVGAEPLLEPCTIAGGPALCFVAWSPTEGEELWVTDGTRGNTRRVADIVPGIGSSKPRNLTAFRSGIVFTADQAHTGRELWWSDGSASGTRLLADLEPGPATSFPNQLTVTADGNTVVFGARTSVTGSELFSTGGSPASTGLLLDLAPGANSGYARDFITAAGVTFFGSSGLWTTDGTATGTMMLSSQGGRLSEAISSRGRLWFPSAAGDALWTSDGTATGTFQVVALPGTIQFSGRLTDAGGQFAFMAQVSGFGLEPCVIAGITATPVDVFPGPEPSFPDRFTSTTGGIVCSVRTGPLATYADRGLVVLAAAGARRIGSMVHVRGLTSLTPGTAIFIACDSRGTELWTTDGTAAGTNLLVDLTPGPGVAASQPVYLGGTPDRMYAMADDQGLGFEPWSYSPGSSPVNLGEIEPGSGGTEGFLLAAADTFDVLALRSSARGLEPYVTDGTSPLVSLGDLASGPASGLSDLWHRRGLASGAAIGGVVVFAAEASGLGEELWVTDGTPGGTRLLVDIVPGPAGSSPRTFVKYRGRVWFVVDTGDLWSTDGTVAGTQSEFSLSTIGFWGPRLLGEYLGELWFSRETAQHGFELFRTDGTAQGTSLVADLATGRASSYLRGGGHVLCEAWDRVAIVSRNLATGAFQLHATDGTPGGTRLLTTLGLETEPAFSGGRLWFRNQSPATGSELWSSDLTPAGTGLFADLAPGPGDSAPGQFAAAGDGFWFFARTAGSGIRTSLWRSDRTPGGTVVASHIEPSVFLPVTVDGGLYLGMKFLPPGRDLARIVNPGAQVEDLGDRCGLQWSRLQATPPVLGGTMRLRGSRAPQNAVGVTGVDLASTPRVAPFGLLEPGCWLHLGVGTVTLARTTTGTWSSQLAIPATPVLSGLQLKLQSVYLRAAGPVHSSNALRITLGG